ncbi:MAG: sigma-54-dependent Fis family transcriptional regulator [Proteobacteria bacterium]|nr:sigma-54-dependent Fis family transcriptional regulator [Pseudomonadota bacterium]
MNEEILVVDDEPDIRSLISLTLEDEGYLTVQAANAEEARAVITSRPPSCIILDIWMRDSDMDGLEVLNWCQNLYPEVPILMISGHGNVETAVQAIQNGAHDFIEKPFKAERLLLTVRRALQQSRLARENAELREQSGASEQLSLVGQSAQIKQLRTTMVAHCARISAENADTELFGSEMLASGRRIVGLFEQAHRGTLYFDELCDLPLETQSRLVRAVAEQTFRRVGGTDPVTTDVRIISASSQDLATAIENGNLKEDLYYRLGVVSMTVPGLAERREDISQLARHFVEECARKLGRPPIALGDDLVNAMRSYDWPGSVRQLRNVIETILILNEKPENGVVGLDGLPAELLSGSSEGGASQILQHSLSLPLREARELFEREYMHSQLQKFEGNISQMAKFVGMERSALHRKLKSLKVEADN